MIRPRLDTEDAQGFEDIITSMREAAEEIIDPRLRAYVEIMADAMVSQWYEPNPVYDLDVNCLGTVRQARRRRVTCR